LGLIVAALAVIEFIISSSFQSLNVQSVNNQKKTSHGKTAPSFEQIDEMQFRTGFSRYDNGDKVDVWGFKTQNPSENKSGECSHHPHPQPLLPPAGEGSFMTISRNTNIVFKTLLWG
jgi:hypothetical protein